MHHLLNHWPRISTRLGSAPAVALFLDFDGTLAPFAPRPDQVSLDGCTRSALSTLARNPHVRLWIISGRRQADVRARVGVPGIRYLGLHGWEGRCAPLPQETSRRLRTLLANCRARLARTPGLWIEDKQYVVAVHYRNTAAHDVTRARAILGRITQSCSERFRIENGKQAWEILPRELQNKGAAVARELADFPAGAVPLYIGDDQTDEPAFDVLRFGITVHVGPGASRARYRLASVAQVRWFLQHLGKEIA